MNNRTNFYVSRKNLLAWIMALCLGSSVVVRIVLACMKGTGSTVHLWCQILLPITASLLFAAIILLDGQERFYKTAIPVWVTAVYFGFAISQYGFGRMVVLPYWVCLVFYAVIYTFVSAGYARQGWVLLPLLACPGAAILYLHRDNYTLEVLPNLLLVLGQMIVVMAIRIHPAGQYHPTWGDRSDGRRIRTMPPMSQVVPYIMVQRNESSNLFSDSFEITHLERYVRQKRREGLSSFGLTHVLLACYVRALCRYPALNRFVAGQKVYSHGEDVQFCITVKKEMSADSPDTVIKVHLNPRDTAEDVYRKMNAEVEKVKNSPLDSSFDNTAMALTLIPGVLLKFTVWLLKLLDYFGLLPGFLLEVSPFHGSLFLTSMGSLGIPPIYHHLYDFGNLPVFGAFGRKRHALELQEDGVVVQRKYIDVKFTLDERIVDGYYYAAFFKHYKRILLHPEILDQPPEEVLPDID